MRIATFFAVFFLSAFQFCGQSLTWSNSSNPVITPSLVVGDLWSLNISSATPNAEITYEYTFLGGPTKTWDLGVKTDGNGNLSYTTGVNEPYTNVGEWTIQWIVGGVPLGPNYDFVVVYSPTGLTVVTTGLASPDCQGSTPIGILGQIQYQITSTLPTGAVISVNSLPPSTIEFTPYEEDTFYDIEGDPSGDFYGYIGTDSSSFRIHPMNTEAQSNERYCL